MDKLQEKEIQILREAIDKADKFISKRVVRSKIIKDILKVIENFIKKKKLLLYGGTAINNILPKYDQFYDPNYDIPDYDFFSTNAIDDAKELADLYAKKGFSDVEAKAGIHIGTYKVFVNFIPIADITQMNETIYNNLKKDQIIRNGLCYTPPNYLRMSCYLELSRPAGDISRWEKVLKRLTLLNKHYPIKTKNCNVNKFKNKNIDEKELFTIVKNAIMKDGLVFFGAYAMHFYGKYISSLEKRVFIDTLNFDVLSTTPKLSTEKLVETLKANIDDDITYEKKNGIDDIIPEHYIVKVNKIHIITIYQTQACYNFNTIKENNNTIKIATIDTMLSFYLAFLYIDKPYYNSERILCMAEYLFRVQARNRFKQTGVLKRFTFKCYGKQHTLQDIRAEKAQIFKKLKDKKNSKKYEKYFLRYFPKTRKKDKKLSN
jgi:hypothetical protein